MTKEPAVLGRYTCLVNRYKIYYIEYNREDIAAVRTRMNYYIQTSRTWVGLYTFPRLDIRVSKE